MNDGPLKEANDHPQNPKGDLSSEELDVLAAAAGDIPSASGMAPDRAPDQGSTPTPTRTDSLQEAGPSVQSFDLEELHEAPATAVDPKRVTMLSDVNMRVKVQLGRTRMLVEDVLKLGEGSVVELDKLAGDPVDILINDRLIARGEVLVLNDNFCVRVSEVLSNHPHRVTE